MCQPSVRFLAAVARSTAAVPRTAVDRPEFPGKGPCARNEAVSTPQPVPHPNARVYPHLATDHAPVLAKLVVLGLDHAALQIQREQVVEPDFGAPQAAPLLCLKL